MKDDVNEEKYLLMREYIKSCILAKAPINLDSLSDAELRGVWLASGRVSVQFDQWVDNVLNSYGNTELQPEESNKDEKLPFEDTKEYKEAVLKKNMFEKDEIETKNRDALNIIKNESKKYDWIKVEDGDGEVSN